MAPRARAFIEAWIQRPAVSVTSAQIPPRAVLIFVAVQVRVGQCTKCGAITRAIPPSIDRKVRHLPVAGKPFSLIFQASPVRCRPCRHTWVGPLACVSPTQLDPKASAQDVVEPCREHNWQRVSLVEQRGDDAVEGIEGWRSRTKAALAASFDGLLLRPRNALAGVSLDMRATDAAVARTQVPQAAMIVDRCQVMKNLQETVQDARRKAQHQLPNPARDEWQGWRWRLGRNDAELHVQHRQKRQRAFESWPELATLHALQEASRGFAERNHRQPARRALETWIATVQQTGHKALLKCVETVRHWEQELLTYCDERITNGCAEGTNNQINLIKRRAFGFRSVETLRSRIRHECGGL